jgi:hypothetical protein
MNSFKNTEWLAFVEKCKKRVNDDNKEFGIDSIFLPQTETCPKPKYLIVSMEPKMNNKKEMERDIKEGYKGFVNYAIDYCAYKLCGNKYEYQLEDFCKGAMYNSDAKEKRNNRYKKWLPLLEEEWKLLGEPKIIVASKTVYNIIEKKLWTGLKIDYNLHYILHDSGANSRWRNKEYKRFKLDSYLPNNKTKEEMTQVIENLLKPYNFKHRLLEDRRRFICIDVKKDKLLALYRHNFEDLKKKGKIEHA